MAHVFRYMAMVSLWFRSSQLHGMHPIPLAHQVLSSFVSLSLGLKMQSLKRGESYLGHSYSISDSCSLCFFGTYCGLSDKGQSVRYWFLSGTLMEDGRDSSANQFLSENTLMTECFSHIQYLMNTSTVSGRYYRLTILSLVA